MDNILEYAQENDAFYNYCLYEYDPLTPVAGKLRSVSLLRHSFSFMNAGRAMYDLIPALRKAVGPGNTVWGLKKAGQAISWEYYFYDYRRRDRERSVSMVLEAMRPWVRTRIIPNENLHYFMFSIDITDDLLKGDGELDTVHLYIGNPGSAVSAGICYAVTEEGACLENFYHFYHPADQMDEIISKIVCSAQIDDLRVPVDKILWPELRQCVTICCANKPRCDCIYFSGITVDQFLFFLGKMDYPEPLVSFVEQHRDRLDHLLFDVGFDYRMEEGALVIPKSGYYGTF
ncbi:MAG: hypothetical protein B5M56_00360 [Desulfococcus sp. 4484_241]|nr:MAG: hypothetical protein B5M56_00360 [Desulfococcus sp. 4484_241]